MAGRQVPWRIFVLAAEPSADALGAGLMQGLQAEAQRRGMPPPVFLGVGGEQMIEAGLESLLPMDRLAVMGLAEVLPRFPSLIRALRKTVEAAWASQADAVVTIDAPDFSFRLQKALAKRRHEAGAVGPRLMHYVAPSVWAWRPGRARRIAGFLDQLLCLLPFEPPYFERAGLPATFVGHPVVAAGAPRADDTALRGELGIPEASPILCVLPGSRSGEVARHLPIYRDVVARLVPRFGSGGTSGLQVVLPTLTHLADRVATATAEWPVPVHILPGGARRRGQAFAASQAALATSGTVALETAVAGLATVVAYRANPLTAAVVQRLVRVRYGHLVNILADRELVPERVQARCRSELLAGEVDRLLADPQAREAQRAAVAPILAHFRAGSSEPGAYAAATVVSCLPSARAHDSERRHDHG